MVIIVERHSLRLKTLYQNKTAPSLYRVSILIICKKIDGQSNL